MSADNDATLNSTEHILRRVEAILEEVRKENDEFKWDFPSFVVTLVIGLIAAAFAGLAIVQALLAAGTGRFKSGKYAIGPWSELTRRSFWSDLRVRTTSETPVITFESAEWGAIVDEMLKDDDFGQLRQGEVQEQDSDEGSFVVRPWALATGRWKGKRRRMSDIVDTVSRKDPQDHFPATWLSLLTILNLDDPSLWPRKRVAADYIPSDLPAVPAHARVRDITHLALIASKGRAKLDFGTDTGHRLPLIRGNTMGLNFRDHPLLGLVGSFDLLDAVKVTLEPAFLTRALCLAHGVGRFGSLGAPVFTASYISSSNDSNDISSFFERTFVRRVLSDSGTYDFIYEGCRHGRNGDVSAYDHWRCASKNWIDPQTMTEFFHQPLQFLAIPFAIIPTKCDNVPPVFPVARSKIRDRLAAFVVQSSVWASGLTCFGVVFRERDWGELGPEVGRMVDIMERVRGAEGRKTRERRQLVNDSSHPLYLAFNPGRWKQLNALAFLKGTPAAGGVKSRKQRSKQPQARTSTRETCLAMIQRIDEWLHTTEQSIREEWNCAAFAISLTAWAIDRLAQERTRIKLSMEDRIQLLEKSDGRLHHGARTRKEFKHIRDDNRGQWLKCKGDVYILLCRRLHRKSMLATLETVVGEWERDWPEIWEEKGTPERDRDESGLGEDGGPEGGKDGRSDSEEEEDGREPTEGQMHALSDLVIYRAILVVALLSSAIDNTEMLEDESLDRIVPFI